MCAKCEYGAEQGALLQFSAGMAVLAEQGLLAADPGLALVAWLMDHHNTTLTGATLAATAARLRYPIDGPEGVAEEILLQDVATDWEMVTDAVPAPVLALVIPFLNFSLSEEIDSLDAIWEEICKTPDFEECVTAILILLELFHLGVQLRKEIKK